MRRFISLLIVLAAGAGFLAWWFSPGQVVKRRTRDLMEVLTLNVATPTGTRNFGTFKLEQLLAPKIEFSVPSMADLNGSHDRADVTSGFSILCSNAKETKFKVKDLHSVTVNGNKATVNASLEILVDLKSAQAVDETGESILHWTKTEDGWRLDGADWMPAKK